VNEALSLLKWVLLIAFGLFLVHFFVYTLSKTQMLGWITMMKQERIIKQSKEESPNGDKEEKG